ncbi:hypothetical protein TD95_003944 [Thielaviopsis punctulata]|uniref:FAD dependent oxidoreductase domain-containing protein n=1 Tax=Thielaviopsis punctulata TaxID=72032 RepID=A0A0F4ZFB2_9PEZI|nr:hypothetical protein TD95_003944 [Thielaviopsis punctulata]
MGQPTLRPGQSDLPSAKSTNSYWHQKPSEKLFGHRSTRTLPRTADVVIIGSGITGAFAAKEAKETWARDLSVVILEAREACWGATGRNGGHCQPNIYAAKPHIAEFETRTFDYLRNLVEENDIQCNWTSLIGSQSFFTQNLVDRARGNLDYIKETRPHLASAATLVTEKHSSGDSLSLEKLRIPSAKGAVVQFRAASLWPYKLVCWVLEDLLERFGPSFNLQTTTPVEHLQRFENVWVVHTSRGQIVAKQVLMATNAYTSHLLPEMTGIITPVQGQVAALVPQAGHAVTPLTNSYVFLSEPADGTPSMDDYLVQVNAGRREFILGGARVLGAGKGLGQSADDTVDAAISKHLVGILPQLLALQGAPGTAAETRETALVATHEWSGIMGFSADGLPWVGCVPACAGGGSGTGLWMCAGYTGHGMAAAALAAKAVVEMMGGKSAEEVDLPPEFVASDERFKAAKALDGRVIDELVNGTVKFDALV